LSPIDWDVLEQVAGQLDQPEVVEAARARVPPLPAVPVAEEAPPEPFALLAGRRVGIYTLKKPSAIRARDIIRRRCPTCEVILNDDKVRTGPLDAMARTCDVVVMVIRVAKHMATESIEDIRRDLVKPTVRAIGASASSIIRELESYLRTIGFD
jgi:hypothetical protein